MNAVQRGREAERVLQEPLLKEAFKIVREKLVQALELAAIGDVNSHTHLTLSLQALMQVKRYLESAVRDGEFELEKQKQDAELESLRGKRGPVR